MENSETKRDPSPAALNVSPYCVHLESKKHFFLQSPAMADEDYLDASRHCWCKLTMQVLGPDKELATPEDCRAPRTCHQGLV
ncbi:MAG: hypothetical protein JNL28_08120 [Planctomycetes bacterium]|nr:hypothetical protein [Planctomycetota bacterium]